MKKCVTLLSENMDQYTSGRIIISYYSSTLHPSYRHVQRLYLRVGNLVVSIARDPRVSVHRMLRLILIAIALYPKFIQFLAYVRLTCILSVSVKVFCALNVPRYMTLPLSSLLDEALYSMANIKSSTCGGRVTVTFIPSVRALLLNLHVSFLTLIGSMK